jgi:WhiB family redox-sensing transcriptional regulator
MAASQIEISGGDDDVEITAEESLDLTLVETRSAELALIEINTDGLPPELAWQERALCAQTDPEAFFPEKGGSTREAKRVCMSCEVRAECLDYALAKDERFGIWGGLSERERRRVKKQAV